MKGRNWDGKWILYQGDKRLCLVADAVDIWYLCDICLQRRSGGCYGVNPNPKYKTHWVFCCGWLIKMLSGSCCVWHWLSMCEVKWVVMTRIWMLIWVVKVYFRLKWSARDGSWLRRKNKDSVGMRKVKGVYQCSKKNTTVVYSGNGKKRVRQCGEDITVRNWN